MADASTSASASTSAAATPSSAADHATFIESSSAYHIGRSERDSDREDDDDDEDDDEKLFAELDKELDMMEDESNFDHNTGDAVASFDMAEFRERRMEELRQEYVVPSPLSPLSLFPTSGPLFYPLHLSLLFEAHTDPGLSLVLV